MSCVLLSGTGSVTTRLVFTVNLRTTSKAYGVCSNLPHGALLMCVLWIHVCAGGSDEDCCNESGNEVCNVAGNQQCEMRALLFRNMHACLTLWDKSGTWGLLAPLKCSVAPAVCTRGFAAMLSQGLDLSVEEACA